MGCGIGHYDSTAMRINSCITLVAFLWVGALLAIARSPYVTDLPALSPVAYAAAADEGDLDVELAAALSDAGFSGRIEQQFHERITATLGRPINQDLANLGRMEFSWNGWRRVMMLSLERGSSPETLSYLEKRRENHREHVVCKQ